MNPPVLAGLATVVLLAATPAVTSPSYAAPVAAPQAASSAPRAGDGVARVPVPQDGRAVDTTHPDHVIGHGSPAGCTSKAVVHAVADGGVIAFDCGPDPVVIEMHRTAKVVNTSKRVVIDGGGLVTLDGGGKRRLLYQDTCDHLQIRVTKHCEDQSFPQLVVQHLTLAHGNSTGELHDMGGGGAIFDRGGRLKVVDSRFVGNRCDATGPDLGGAAVRAFQQYHDQPLWIVGSTFLRGRCSNGGALSGLNVDWRVLNCRFLHNQAIGHGKNPPIPGTPGGGSGGAIYNDGEDFDVRIGGTLMQDNRANELAGAIFFVSNDLTGTMSINRSTLQDNPSSGPESLPGVYFEGQGPVEVVQSLVS